MEKIEQIENLKNSQIEVAKDFGLERFLDQPEFTKKDAESRFKHQIFGLLKQEISSHLSSIDALFTASIVLEEPELQQDICHFLDGICGSLAEFIVNSSDLDEEGGDNEIS